MGGGFIKVLYSPSNRITISYSWDFCLIEFNLGGKRGQTTETHFKELPIYTKSK